MCTRLLWSRPGASSTAACGQPVRTSDVGRDPAVAHRHPRVRRRVRPQPLCTEYRPLTCANVRSSTVSTDCYDYDEPLHWLRSPVNSCERPAWGRTPGAGPAPGSAKRTGPPACRDRVAGCSLQTCAVSRVRRPPPASPKDPSREVPRRPRRARRCRRLGCPQPAGPPQRPGPRRPADRGQRRGPGALHLRLRDLGPRHARPPRSPTRAGPGQRPAARRHLPQPARPSRSRWCSTAPGSR